MPSAIELAARLSDVVSVQQEILGTARDAVRLEALVVMKAAEMTGGVALSAGLGGDRLCRSACNDRTIDPVELPPSGEEHERAYDPRAGPFENRSSDRRR